MHHPNRSASSSRGGDNTNSRDRLHQEVHACIQRYTRESSEFRDCIREEVRKQLANILLQQSQPTNDNSGREENEKLKREMEELKRENGTLNHTIDRLNSEIERLTNLVNSPVNRPTVTSAPLSCEPSSAIITTPLPSADTPQQNSSVTAVEVPPVDHRTDALHLLSSQAVSSTNPSQPSRVVQAVDSAPIQRAPVPNRRPPPSQPGSSSAFSLSSTATTFPTAPAPSTEISLPALPSPLDQKEFNLKNVTRIGQGTFGKAYEVTWIAQNDKSVCIKKFKLSKLDRFYFPFVLHGVSLSYHTLGRN